MTLRLLVGDVRERLAELPDNSVHLALTSPPYFSLRDYGVSGQIGLEATPAEFVATMVEVFRAVRRVLHPSGVLVLNLGDSYAGSGKGPSNSIQYPASNIGRHPGQFANGQAPTAWVPVPDGAKPKDLLEIPSEVALALRRDGWYLRSRIPWLKRNAMPESTTDRPSTSVEYLFLFAKSRAYFWDAEAIRVGDQEYTRKGTPGGHKLTQQPGYKGLAGGTLQRDPDEPYGFARDITTVGRNRRNGDWFMESWQGLMLDEAGDPLALVVNPMPLKEAHFASFPPKLVEPFVRAGTSERGCCGVCGAPWRRVVDYQRNGTDWRSGDRMTKSRGADQRQPEIPRTTTGWEPTCPHGGEPVPCTVLDPFAGSGTTLLVADRLGRDAVGIDLNPAYARDIAAKRLTAEAPLFTQLSVEEAAA